MKIGAGSLFLNNTAFTNAFSGGIYLHDGITRTGPGPQFGDSLLTQDNGARLISNQNGVFNAKVFIGTGGAVRESDFGYTVFRNGPIVNVNDSTNFGGLTAADDQTASSIAGAGKLGLGGVNSFGGAGQSATSGT